MASTSRKSNVSLVTVSFCHVVPPSAVRNTVDPAPLAHATLSLTALTPRNRTLTPLVCTVQCGAANSINVITVRSFCVSTIHDLPITDVQIGQAVGGGRITAGE